MKRKTLVNIGLLAATLTLAVIITGCGALTPQFSYQGRLTDEGGNPLDGAVTMYYRLYDDSTGGNLIYKEWESESLNDGLFDSAIGPSALDPSVSARDLSQPLWLEVAVNNGVYSETLTPRQRLYGAPYAFTLMQGAVVASSMDTDVWAAGGAEAVLSVENSYDGNAANPALPALRLVGETSLELGSPTLDDGTIRSDQSGALSDLFVYSNDEIWLYLDANNANTSEFRVYGGNGSQACEIQEDGDLLCAGTKSAAVQIQEEQRLMYAIESSEVWFEDFGTAGLQKGAEVVSVDPLFAKTVNLSADYHVYLTALGDCGGLYVTNKTSTGFEVRELGGGSSSVSFDYRIVAKRLGYEDLRMELFSTQLDEAEGDGK